ncbi:MFS general substrate transporter [Ascobolus immersus RN42]|uniref:MFS general substrate transporter n=1 Tax=Ascobolus immersus RN42 TaxID=1160509 RepID=A0A3N4IPY9_ASCIM|nr:MFS general substrate transporter [Ascobolus immersus RN42]
MVGKSNPQAPLLAGGTGEDPLLQDGFHEEELNVERVPAFEVPRSIRLLQVACAVVFCLFAAGPVFGYAALKPVLIEEEVYRDQCTPEEIHDKVRVCTGQELRLNLMFTAAAVTTNVSALLVGTILDTFGPHVAGFLGGLFSGLGMLVLAFAPFFHQYMDAYIVGYMILALGGPFVFISSFHLSNAFPAYSGSILALLTGAFDSSSIVFFVYQVLYKQTGLTPHKFFLLFLTVPAVIIIAQLTIMPNSSYKTFGELVQQKDETIAELDASDDESRSANTLRVERRERRESVVSEITELLGDKNAIDEQIKEDEKREMSGVWGVMHGKSIREQVVSPWWILITLFTVVQMTRINYFVATIFPQYEHLLGYESAEKLNAFFDIALPLGGVLSIPFIGTLLDNTRTITVLTILVGLATTIGVLGLIPNIWCGYINIALFVVYRPFYYTTVSDYCAKVFGFATFGTVYGAMICLSGLLNLGQTGLDWLTTSYFQRDPVPVNLGLLAAALAVGLALVTFVHTKEKEGRRAMLERAAKGGSSEHMPFAGGSNDYQNLQN